MSTRFSKSRLPPDILRLIFENILSDYPTTASKLCLISSTVKAWIEPILYRNLRIDNHRIHPRCIECTPATSLPDATCFATRSSSISISRLRRFSHHTRNVLIQNRQAREVELVLGVCNQAENVALWLIHGDVSGVLSILRGEIRGGGLGRSLKRLSVDPASIRALGGGGRGGAEEESGSEEPATETKGLNEPSRPGRFENLTHLEYVVNGTPHGLDILHDVVEHSQLPQLRYLATIGRTATVHDKWSNGGYRDGQYSYWGPSRRDLEVLRRCPGLRVWVDFRHRWDGPSSEMSDSVVEIGSRRHFAEEADEDDDLERFVLSKMGHVDMFARWERATRSKNYHSDRAERLVEEYRLRRERLRKEGMKPRYGFVVDAAGWVGGNAIDKGADSAA